MRRLFILGIFILSILIIINLVRSMYGSWKKQDVLKEAEIALREEKMRYKELQEKLKQAKSLQFIEREARDKLFLVKENEQELIIPQVSPQASPSGTPRKIPVWRQWFLLLFGREEE